MLFVLFGEFFITFLFSSLFRIKNGSRKDSKSMEMLLYLLLGESILVFCEFNALISLFNNAYELVKNEINLIISKNKNYFFSEFCLCYPNLSYNIDPQTF